MEKHYYLKHFYDQLFYKFIGFGLFLFDLKSEYWKGYEPTKNKIVLFQKAITLVGVILTVVSQMLYFYLNFTRHEFETLAMMYTMIPVVIMISLKLVIAQTPGYRNAMQNFPDKINLHSLYSKTMDKNREFLEQLIIKTEKYSRWSCAYVYVMILASGSAFLIAPIVRNIENNESTHNITTRLEILIHVYVPFDYEFNFYNYLMMQIIVTYTTYVGITILTLFDTLSLMFFYHLLGHILYFKHIVKMLSVEQKNFNEKEIQHKLVEITSYYHLIKGMLRDIEAAFGWNIVGMYLHNLIAGGIQIFQFMNAGKDTGVLMSYGLMTPLYMGELMIVSYALEQLRTEGSDIPTHIYNLHWEEMSISNQKIVLFIICQTQPKFEFTATLNTETGVKPALNIFKTTFSYYLMIKAKI